MPPANSPVEAGTPQRSPSAIRPPHYSSHRPVPALPPLRLYIPSAVQTQSFYADTEDDIEEENIAFLRTRHDPAEGMADTDALAAALRDRRRRREGQQTRVRTASEEGREQQLHNSRQNQLRQRLDSPGAWSSRSALHGRSAYGHGVPNHQSLFDWAPSGSERSDQAQDYETILTELSRQQPNTHPEILRVLARARFDSNRETRNRTASRPSGQHGQPHEPSLRSAAILQSFRRNHRVLARSRDYMRNLADNHDASAPDNITHSTTSAHSYTRTDSPLPALTSFTTNESGTYSSSYGEMTRSFGHEPERTARGNIVRHGANGTFWEETDHSTPNSRMIRHGPNGTFYEYHERTPDTQSTRAENLEALRRRYLENPSSKVSEFERIIKYLHMLRSAENDLEAVLQQASDPQTVEKPLCIDTATRLKMHAGCPPSPTSWLSPGTLFTGTQQANPHNMSSAATMHHLVHGQPGDIRRLNSNSQNTPFEGSAPHWLRHMSTSEILSLYSSPTPPHQSPGDRWTVKVSIHNVDYDTMTLQGTMEAFNVPALQQSSTTTAIPTSSSLRHSPPPSLTQYLSSQHQHTAITSSSSTHGTSFCTYLEGELIDFSNHTLLTESDVFGVKTTPDIDAAYWRRLEPFAKLTDDEIAHALLDRTWIEQQLMGRYVLMRWKERCFVKPLSSVHSGEVASSQSQRGPSSHFTAGRMLPPLPRDSTTSFVSGADGNGYGLSISGFYYVSLRRSDGRLEGLYFDPQSSPYQHLELLPRAGGFGSGSWECR